MQDADPGEESRFTAEPQRGLEPHPETTADGWLGHSAAVPQRGKHWGTAALCPSHPLEKSARRYQKRDVSRAGNAEETG